MVGRLVGPGGGRGTKRRKRGLSGNARRAAQAGTSSRRFILSYRAGGRREGAIRPPLPLSSRLLYSGFAAPAACASGRNFAGRRRRESGLKNPGEKAKLFTGR